MHRSLNLERMKLIMSFAEQKANEGKIVDHKSLLKFHKDLVQRSVDVQNQASPDRYGLPPLYSAEGVSPNECLLSITLQ